VQVARQVLGPAMKTKATAFEPAVGLVHNHGRVDALLASVIELALARAVAVAPTRATAAAATADADGGEGGGRGGRRDNDDGDGDDDDSDSAHRRRLQTQTLFGNFAGLRHLRTEVAHVEWREQQSERSVLLTLGTLRDVAERCGVDRDGRLRGICAELQDLLLAEAAAAAAVTASAVAADAAAETADNIGNAADAGGVLHLPPTTCKWWCCHSARRAGSCCKRRCASLPSGCTPSCATSISTKASCS
jgi:hypothetical protein